MSPPLKGAPPPIRWPQKQNARPVQPAMPNRLAPPPVPPARAVSPPRVPQTVQRQPVPGGAQGQVAQPYSWLWPVGGAGLGLGLAASWTMAGALGAGVVGAVAGALGGAAVDYATDYYHWSQDATPWQYLSRGVGGSLRGAALVEALFNRFLGYRFRYDVSQANWQPMVGGHSETTPFLRGTDEVGNCEAFAGAFAELLVQAGIPAQARAVRTLSQGHFIVRAPSFIDPSVRGNVFNNGRLVPGYYVFDNHWATWLPSLNRFYDPMARKKYTQTEFDQSILVCNLVKLDQSGDLFGNQNGGNILPDVAGKNQLVRRNGGTVAGRLEAFDLQ